MDPDGKILISKVRSTRWNKSVFKSLEIEKVGLYSVSKEREYFNNTENMKYICFPKKYPLDLDSGFGTAFQKDSEENLYLNHILMFIKDNQNELIERNECPEQPNRLKADLVCYRGTMRIIMSSPYDILTNWRVLSSKFNGTIYMMREGTAQEKMELMNRSEQNKRMCAWGFKFEQYCTTSTFNEQPNIEEPVDECSELCCMIKTNIKGRTYLYSAEMHGVESSKPVGEINKENVSSLRFVELKTKMMKLNARQVDSYYRHKTRHWWIQSYLAGISDIYVGQRDGKGLVFRIDKISTEQLFKEAARRSLWEGLVCLEFLDNFNNQVANVMNDITDPNTVVQCDYNCDTEAVTYKVFHGKTEKSFLPSWYQQMFNKKRSSVSSIMSWIIFVVFQILKAPFQLLSIKKTHPQHKHQ